MDIIDDQFEPLPMRSVDRFALAALVWISFFGAQQIVFAQSPATYTPQELRRHFQNVAESYQMRAGGRLLSLREQPLMHWQNTVRQQEQGGLYLWEKNGRPQVLGSIFTYQLDDQVRCRHEMISVSDTPLTSALHAKTVWSPKLAGVEWTPVDGVPKPPESAPRRMTQMRGIARQFSGTLKIPDQQPSSLTLIPQPLVRYQAADAGVIDGAIFSFAVVTDPEIFFLIEAQKSAGGSLGWFFAAARSHYHASELRRQNQIVWEAPMVIEIENTNWGQAPWAHQPYFGFNPPQPLPAPEALR